MKCKIEFEMNNEAFADNAHGEAAKVLQFIVAELESGADYLQLRDTNGNPIGEFRIEHAE
jgi:hypothetical protein